MVKVKTEARREAILAAASDVFQELGFEQATMSEITARVGGSKATLYRYFASKEALFMELVRRSAMEHRGEFSEAFSGCAGPHGMGTLPPEATEALALLDPNEDVEIALQRFGERVLKHFYSPQKVALKRMVIAAAANNPELGRLFYENGIRQGTALMERYFESVITAEKLRGGVAPKVVVAHFRGLLESEFLELSLLNVPVQLGDKKIKGIVERAVDAFMRAYGSAPA